MPHSISTSQRKMSWVVGRPVILCPAKEKGCRLNRDVPPIIRQVLISDVTVRNTVKGCTSRSGRNKGP